MHILDIIKSVVVSIAVTAVSFVSSVGNVAWHKTTSILGFTNDVDRISETSNETLSNIIPCRIKLTPLPDPTTASSDNTITNIKKMLSVSSIPTKFEVGNKNPFQKPLPTSFASSTAGTAPSIYTGSSSEPSPTPDISIAESASPSPSSSPIPTPDFSVGTLLAEGYPANVIAGNILTFKVFVRDDQDMPVRNKTAAFVINGTTKYGTNDSDGYAPLDYKTDPKYFGSLTVNVILAGKSSSFSVQCMDSRPVIAMSVFAITSNDFSVRLMNGLGEPVPNWQVTATRRDGTIIATKLTSELGFISFDRPERDDQGYYACAIVKDIGTQCAEF